MHTHPASSVNGFATGAQLPDDGVDKVKAQDVNPVLAATLDNTAYLRAHAALDTDAADDAGDPNDANPGTYNFSGTLRLVDSGERDAKFEVGAATKIELGDEGALEAIAETAFVRARCRKRLLRRRVGAPFTLADADQTVDVTMGDRFQLNGAPAVGGRVITLSKTTGAPEEGETMTFFLITASDGGGGLAYTFNRAGGSTIATIVLAGVGAGTKQYWAEFEYCLISTGPDVLDWRLGINSGMMFDGTDDYGVINGGSA